MNEKVTSSVEEHKERWLRHSTERAMERYGLVFNKNVQNKIVSDYHMRVFNKLLDIKENPNRSVLRGRINNTIATFVYDKHYEVVITFLHNSWVKQDSIDSDDMYVAKKKTTAPPKRGRRMASKPPKTGFGKRITKSRIQGASYKRSSGRDVVDQEMIYDEET